MSQNPETLTVPVPSWPLAINTEMDEHAVRRGLAHWSCTSSRSNEWWIRRDGFPYRVTFANNVTYEDELRKADLHNDIQEFVF